MRWLARNTRPSSAQSASPFAPIVGNDMTALHSFISTFGAERGVRSAADRARRDAEDYRPDAVAAGSALKANR